LNEIEVAVIQAAKIYIKSLDFLLSFMMQHQPSHVEEFQVPADWKDDGEVDVTDFPACRVAAIRCVGDISHENKVIQYLFRYWLPRSHYQPANLPGMEIYRRQPAEMGWEEYDIDCAVPVVPLQQRK
jgi:predicted transcriptional regulator YdeE